MIGEPLIELSCVDSTNTYVAGLLSGDGLTDGAVVWAHEQFAGRGQQDHVWLSEPGKNLTFTVCLRPCFLAPERQFSLNQAVATGMADLVGSFLSGVCGVAAEGSESPPFPVRIKWPNDIYAGTRKMGGILIEHRIMGATIDFTIAGIGLNINQVVFPPELPNPVSLAQLLGREVPVREVLDSALHFLDMRYRALRNDPVFLQQEYDSTLLGFGEWRTFVKEGEPFDGKIVGTDPYGRLRVLHRNGTLHAYAHPEVMMLMC